MNQPSFPQGPKPSGISLREKNGVMFAGTHLIIDFYGAATLDDAQHIEDVLTECVEVAGATLLHTHFHHFTPNNGVTGVAVLAESHISIHTWPEYGYAAIDVFMCGNTAPERTIQVLEQAFQPERVEITEHLRGQVQDEPGTRVHELDASRRSAAR